MKIAFATIGNASTAEGMFWESVNAIGVLKAPAIVTIYDDGYGISVPNQFQMVKENIGTLLKGFERNPNLPFEKVQNGYDHYTVHAPGIIPRSSKPISAPPRSRANITSPRWCMSLT
jgi:2-oxoisovalerate dehydrogenase E1 component